MADRTPRFTRITGMLSGVQQDEADIDAEAPESLLDWFPHARGPVVDRPDYLPGTFDPLSDPLDDPFPEELE